MARRSRGFSLVEVIVASGLLGLLLAAVVLQQRTGTSEARHHEDRRDLAAAATLLQRALSRDLRRSFPLGVLPADDRPRGEARPGLVLPLQAEYRGDARRSLRFQRLEYTWSPATQKLTRSGQVLPLPGVAALEFTWSQAAPTTLSVALVGVTHGLGVPSRLGFEVSAPPGTDTPQGWTPAPHHRGAQERRRE